MMIIIFIMDDDDVKYILAGMQQNLSRIWMLTDIAKFIRVHCLQNNNKT